jgi:hypothetical protein
MDIYTFFSIVIIGYLLSFIIGAKIYKSGFNDGREIKERSVIEVFKDKVEDIKFGITKMKAGKEFLKQEAKEREETEAYLNYTGDDK